MNDFTTIYYTSCREEETFENKIKAKLLEVCGDIPIISVSHKPIDLGDNICVGDVGASDHNLFRQLLLACNHAKTKYVISCEADCLYPPEYFKFVPDGTAKCYRFEELYILNEWGKGEWGGFWPKGTAPFAQVAEREWYIKEIENGMIDRPVWSEDGDKHRVKIFMQNSPDRKIYKLGNPVISVKTGNGMRVHTEPSGDPVPELPYWGKAEDLRKELWG